MKGAEKYIKSQAVADMILAYKTFVLNNQGKTATQVKQELLHKSIAC